MLNYLARRLLLILPTIFGVMLINFAIVQIAPGGPIQTIISRMKGDFGDVETRLGGQASDNLTVLDSSVHDAYRGSQGIDPEFIKDLERQFGFDKPAHERFFLMMKNYLKFDFGVSYFRDQNVMDLIKSKLPVSISLGLWTTLLVYLISIPLGISKAVRNGSRFDLWSSSFVVISYAVPSFLFALFLIIFFAGGSFIQIFPLRGLFSEGWENFSFLEKILDYFWHLALPLTAMLISGFAKLTLLTKNSFLEEINKQYVVTARAKGLEEKQILYGHIFRNAMLVVVAGFPTVFIHILFTSSLLIEVLFSLDGLGLLGFESALSRDYPVIFGSLYVFTLLGMVMHIIGDFAYMLIDKRIDLRLSKR